MSCKQKVNSRSSTEAKLIGVDNAMNFVIWVNLFIVGQVAGIPNESVVKKLGCKTVIQQDNTSTIQLERNEKQSSTRRTRHCDITYFHVTSKVKSGEVQVASQHLPES